MGICSTHLVAVALTAAPIWEWWCRRNLVSRPVPPLIVPEQRYSGRRRRERDRCGTTSPFISAGRSIRPLTHVHGSIADNAHWYLNEPEGMRPRRPSTTPVPTGLVRYPVGKNIIITKPRTTVTRLALLSGENRSGNDGFASRYHMVYAFICSRS
jgi:hypothetical protein